MESRSDWRRHMSDWEEIEKKDVISIEREVRGNREGDVSNAIDVYKKEEGAEDRTQGQGNPRGNK